MPPIVSPLDDIPFQRPPRRVDKRRISLEFCAKLDLNVRRESFWDVEGEVAHIVKENRRSFEKYPELVSSCLVLHNICIIFGDNFWKTKWLQETTDEVQSALCASAQVGASTHKRLADANHALSTLAGIDDNYRENIEDMKQECAKEFQIAMATGGKTPKELSARRNGIGKSLWMAKTKACIAKTF